MSQSYRSLNLRGGTSIQKEQQNVSVRAQAQQKNRHHLWEKLTFNYLKKYVEKIPHRNNLGQADKVRLQQIVGEEVSQFLESNQLTDKSLRELEANLEQKLIVEGFLKEERRQSYQTMSPSKLEKRQGDQPMTYNEISKVMSDRDLLATKRQQTETLPNVKKNLASLQTVRGTKDTQPSNTLKEAAKQLILNQSFVHSPLVQDDYIKPNHFSTVQQQNQAFGTPLGDILPLQDPQVNKRKELVDLGIDGASMLSENEWAEVINYQREMDEEKLRKEREQRDEQKRRMKQELETQLNEKRDRQQQEKEAKIKHDAQLMSNLKEKEESEATLKNELRTRALQQKTFREDQLKEAQLRKLEHQTLKQETNAQAIEQLHRQVEFEKERQRIKFEEKRQKEQRVLSENQEYVMSKQERKKKEKFDDLSAFNDYKSRIDSDDNRRQEERQAREERIKRLLNRVPTVTVEQQGSHMNDQEFERKVRDHQLQRDQFEEQLMLKKKEDSRKMNEDMKKRLDMQIEEKRAKQQQDRMIEQDYHRNVIGRLKEEEENEKMRHELRKKQHLENRTNLLLQMGQFSSSVAGGSSVGSPSSVAGTMPRKRVVMESMTPEELRLNKAMLQEISQRKRERLQQVANLQTINEQ